MLSNIQVEKWLESKKINEGNIKAKNLKDLAEFYGIRD